MWKTSPFCTGKSLENVGKSKSSPQRFPQKASRFVENFEKSKYVQIAQFYLLMVEKWEKQEAKKWEKCEKT